MRTIAYVRHSVEMTDGSMVTMVLDLSNFTNDQRSKIESLYRTLLSLDRLAATQRLSSANRPMVEHCIEMLSEAFPDQ